MSGIYQLPGLILTVLCHTIVGYYLNEQRYSKKIFVLCSCFHAVIFASLMGYGCRTDFADIQNKKECGGNSQWQNHYLRNWAANTKGKGII